MDKTDVARELIRNGVLTLQEMSTQTGFTKQRLCQMRKQMRSGTEGFEGDWITKDQITTSMAGSRSLEFIRQSW